MKESEDKLMNRPHISRHNCRKASIYRQLILCLSVFFVAYLSPIANANAALVKKDLVSAGDQLVILDTDTNLEWLSLDATKNRSIDSLISGTSGPDYLGEFGFHFSSQTELGVVWGNAGVPLSTSGLTSTFTSAITQLISFLGTPSPLFSGSEIVGESLIGIYNVNGAGCFDGFHQTASLSVLDSGLSSSHAFSPCFNNVAGTSRGKYLVRTSPVPRPRNDFNADGTSDVLFQNSGDGRLLIWTMNNFFRASLLFPASLAAAWDVVGTGDFNGDGTDDVFYKHTAGGTAIAEFTNAARRGLQFPGGINPILWAVHGVGDFNGDGTDDVLWRRTTDSITMLWGITHAARTTIAFPGGIAAAWTVRGVGDFNGDGTDDILYQHTDGRLLIWEMNNYTRNALHFPASIANTWTVVGVGDFNGDGTDDVLYRKTDGQTAIAEFRNFARRGLQFPGGVNPVWTVQDSGDYNGDGTDDILLRRTTDSVTMM